MKDGGAYLSMEGRQTSDTRKAEAKDNNEFDLIRNEDQIPHPSVQEHFQLPDKVVSAKTQFEIKPNIQWKTSFKSGLKATGGNMHHWLTILFHF